MALAEDFDYSERGGWRRRIVPLVLLLLVVGGAAFGAWWYFLRDDSPAAAAAAEQDATVTTGNLVSSFSTTGTANAQLNTKVTFGAHRDGQGRQRRGGRQGHLRPGACAPR